MLLIGIFNLEHDKGYDIDLTQFLYLHLNYSKKSKTKVFKSPINNKKFKHEKICKITVFSNRLKNHQNYIFEYICISDVYRYIYNITISKSIVELNACLNQRPTFVKII